MTESEKKTADYLKLAFCVDGEVTLATNDLKVDEKFGIMYRLEDSQRGTFYVALLVDL
jgi:hypothetical protein